MAEEPTCICGNNGCVEAYAGGWALIRAGDPAAVRLARRAGRILGEAIAGAVSLLNPALVSDPKPHLERRTETLHQ